MAYITREDGEHFVIPSYRDTLTAKNKNALKKDILQLSEQYGSYLAIQRKDALQYEVAFSPDTGYLLGESIWHYFKSPQDMIYCEAVPGTAEAILVIVKAGAVYLDGLFPVDSIIEELVIFLTQKNNFAIYLYGDVPISRTHEEGKLTFEPGSIKSFTQLDQPAFINVPLLKIYQLQVVEAALRAQGIGVFPVREVGISAAIVIIGVLLWTFFSRPAPPPAVTVNPYQTYYTMLTSPAPDQEIQQVVNQLTLLLTIPGWSVSTVNYANGVLQANIVSFGGKVASLDEWTKLNDAVFTIKPSGILLTVKVKTSNRPPPTTIYDLQEVLGLMIDKLAAVYPGNKMTLGAIQNKPLYHLTTFTINVSNVSPDMLVLIGQQTKDLPMVLRNMKLSVNNGNVSGSIIFEMIGS
ncbi:MAG TPA: hypothetical protein VHZ76_06745 [Gammaproteobacteria bacterium]|jgi:hypothetical protein|nr:hypothetical protein [Gammaproteobacteria bacterium]